MKYLGGQPLSLRPERRLPTYLRAFDDQDWLFPTKKAGLWSSVNGGDTWQLHISWLNWKTKSRNIPCSHADGQATDRCCQMSRK